MELTFPQLLNGPAMPTYDQKPPDRIRSQNKGSRMINPESSLQLQRLLAILKSKAPDMSMGCDRQASNEIISRSVIKNSHEMIDPDVSSRLQRLLEMLIKKTADGLVEWEERIRDELFSTSIGKSSFIVETRHANAVSQFYFGMYDAKGALISRVTSADKRYPEGVRDQIQELWTTVSARASYLVSFLDQALNALDD
jgi:hypothetical protein